MKDHEPARKSFKCGRKACGLAQTSHGRNDAGAFVCKDGATTGRFHKATSGRIPASFNREQVELLDEIRLVMQRGGDVRHLARRPGFAALARCVAKMRARADRSS